MISNFSDFLYRFNGLLCEILGDECFNVVIGGDFNVDFLPCDGECSARVRERGQFMDVIDSHGLKITVQAPTRGKACLDNLLVYKNCLAAQAEIVNMGYSDHFAQLLRLNIVREPKKPRFVYRRLYLSKNISLFKSYLEQETWQSVYVQTCPNEAFDVFFALFLHYFNKCFPKKRVLQRNEPSKDRWITPEILQVKGLLVTLSDMCKKYPNFKGSYRAVNRYYQGLISDAKRGFHDREISSALNRTKKMWEIINRYKGDQKIGLGRDVVLEDDKSALSPQESAEKFNTFFCSLGSNLAAKFGSVTNYASLKIDSLPGSFFFVPVSALDVALAINDLKSSNSSGFDEITSRLVKDVKDFILTPLAYLINMSFDSGVFPEKLKLAVVRPLFKKGNPGNVSDYRPVSLLPTFSKVYEYLINKRLCNYFINKNILHKAQHGFVKGRGLDTALFSFVNEVVKIIDHSSAAVGLFVDLSKAFDSINHSILLYKLFQYGVRGPINQWFKSYLGGRTQITKLDSADGPVYSSIEHTSFGVPQGSILGPILFNIYINDLFKTFHSLPCLPVAYADDINVVFQSSSGHQAVIEVSNLLTRIGEWMHANKLTINDNKTTFMSFRSSRSSLDFLNEMSASVGGLSFSSSTRLLGLYVDEHLNWSVHLNHLCGRLSSACYGLRSMSQHCNRHILRTLYFAHFHSQLRYGIIHWALCTDFSRVFVIQKYAVRIIAGLKYGESCRSAFKDLNILTAIGVYIYELVCFVRTHKNLFDGNAVDHKYETRHRQLLSCDLHSSTLYQKGAHYRGCFLYNLVPAVIKEAASTPLFKKKLREHIVGISPYNLFEFIEAHRG